MSDTFSGTQILAGTPPAYPPRIRAEAKIKHAGNDCVNAIFRVFRALEL